MSKRSESHGGNSVKPRKLAGKNEKNGFVLGSFFKKLNKDGPSLGSFFRKMFLGEARGIGRAGRRRRAESSKRPTSKHQSTGPRLSRTDGDWVRFFVLHILFLVRAQRSL